MSNIPPLPKATKGGRPYMLDDKDSEQLLSMVIALMGEVSALKDRVANLTAVAGAGQPFTNADVEAYEPVGEELSQRNAQRAAMIDRVMRIVIAETERAANPVMSRDYADVMAMVTADT